jgi:hypothetical protein
MYLHEFASLNCKINLFITGLSGLQGIVVATSCRTYSDTTILTQPCQAPGQTARQIKTGHYKLRPAITQEQWKICEL